jgi:hypothetical protein
MSFGARFENSRALPRRNRVGKNSSSAGTRVSVGTGRMPVSALNTVVGPSSGFPTMNVPAAASAKEH